MSLLACVRLGQPGAALNLLPRAMHERGPNALCLRVDPAFDSLCGEPRFAALLRHVHGKAINLGVNLGVNRRMRPGAAA